jgi:hypothetical protein
MMHLTEVEEIFQLLIPNKETRGSYLSILLESISIVDSCGKNKWGIYCKITEKEKIKLLVGNVIILTIGKEYLWLALDQNLIESSNIDLETANFWKWDEKDYPIYKSIHSKNGYYISSDLIGWEKIKHLHFEAIKNAANKYGCLNKHSQLYHSDSILDYIALQLSCTVPKPLFLEKTPEKLFQEILKTTAQNQDNSANEIRNYWWFGINNSKSNKGHINYLEITPFLNGEQTVFHWRYGGSSYSKKFYPQLKIGDKIVFWMGHGDFELWGIIGFGYISKINIEEKLVHLKLIDAPKTPLTPYPKNNPQETKEVLFLKDLFGLEFYALRDIFYQLKYVTQRTTPVTIDKITSTQYEELLGKLSLFTEDFIKFFPEEIDNDKKEQFYEGAVKQITVNSYERDVKARQKCIEIYGLNCAVCGFNFEEKYGKLGKNFIHIHHLNPLSEIREKYIVDPEKDLRPVCPNCHAMLHKKKETLSIEELKKIFLLINDKI